MSNRRLIPVVPVVLAAVLVAAVWWIGHQAYQRQYSPEAFNLAKSPPSPVAAEDTQESAGVRGSGVQPQGIRMSDLEFKRLKVSLPTPVNKPWKGPFFDSRSCSEPDKKEIAVEVLPTWIRQALAANNPEMAARYFWSLIKLSEDKEPAIATKGVLAIYRLGDFHDTASDRMRDWIESGFAYRYSDSTSGSSTSKDIRAQVLEELEFNNDRSLDQSIYDAWQRNQTMEVNDLAAVDYAYYLEKHGRELPADYWMQRLDKPSSFANALEIAEKKGTPEVISKLEKVFEQLRARPAASADAGRAAAVASALFRQTGDAGYRDYLAEQARTQLASGSFESSLPKVLEGLAATNDKAALEVVSAAMEHENAIIREMAIDALGRTRDPAAAELLFEAAVKKAKEGKGFPAREMRALLAQDDPSSDSKYERLQQALLSGQFGWSATTGDFEALEFFRKHGCQ